MICFMCDFLIKHLAKNILIVSADAIRMSADSLIVFSNAIRIFLASFIVFKIKVL